MPTADRPPDLSEILDKEAAGYLGKRGLLPVAAKDPKLQSGDPKLLVPVRVVAAKHKFGRVYVNVTPIGGHNAWWVYAERVTFE